MTFFKRLYPFFRPGSLSPVTGTLPAPVVPESYQQPTNELIIPIPAPVYNQPVPLPDWLVDEEALRDEGVFWGLSVIQPDEKINEIRACFNQQSAQLEVRIDEYTGEVNELNRRIEQHENRLVALQDQITSLHDKQPISSSPIQTVVSLLLLGIMCIGTFYLVDETLRSDFPNRWIAVGVFLAGMFNLSGHVSFYESDSQLTGRRLVAELGLPLATSLFIFIQALKAQPVWQATGLFVFVFFLFLLAGKRVLSTLTTLQADLTIIQTNRQLAVDKQTRLPRLEADLERLRRETDALRMQKQSIVTVLSPVEVDLAQLNARRDQLVNLFLGEFELARSIRDRLTEPQRQAIFN